MTDYSKFAHSTPLLAEIYHNATSVESKFIKTFSNDNYSEYKLSSATGCNTASIICAGQIPYYASAYNRASYGNVLNFRTPFKYLKKVFDTFSDLTVGNLTSIVAKNYIGSEFTEDVVGMEHYFNAREEYLDALRYAGFNHLAMASSYNACAGAIGISATEQALKDHDLMYSGIGSAPLPIYNLNGIRIAILSYTYLCFDADRYLTEEGKSALLSIYSSERCSADIKRLKDNNVDFVLVYISFDEDTKIGKRREIGCQIAEDGADYVICTNPKVVSKYTTHTTTDGRSVPIAAGLNELVGRETKYRTTALLNIMLRKNQATGETTIADSYIPVAKFTNYLSCPGAALPCMSVFGTFPTKAVEIEKTCATLADKFKNTLPIKYYKGKSIHDDVTSHFTYGEIIDLLGAKTSTLLDACNTAGISMNDPVVFLSGVKKELRPGSIAFIFNMGKFYKANEFEISIADAIEAGASMVVDTVNHPELPTIVVDNCIDARNTVSRAIKNKYCSAKTVAITGTSGKTTTTQLISSIASCKFNTLNIRGNYNTAYTIPLVLQHLTPDTEVYVQEIHGGTLGHPALESSILNPDIVVITSIGEGHLNELGDVETVLKNKLGLIDSLKNDGVLIIDNDDQYLHNIKPGCKVVRCSLTDKNCDFYADNIINDGLHLEFDICHNGIATPIVLNAKGEHNIRNSVSAFAAATLLGVEPELIAMMLSTYRADGIRQNVIEHEGYTFIVDIYSNAPPAVISAVRTLGDYPRDKYPRKIAILGDIATAEGENSREAHKRIGREIAGFDYDIMIAFGGNADQYTVEAKANGKEVYYFDRDEVAEMNKTLCSIVQKGDLILLKSGIFHHIEDNTIYPLFGRLKFQ